MKKIIFFGAIAVIIISFLAYRWYRWSQCKADENKPCSPAVRTASGSVPVSIPVTGIPTGKTIKCNFWMGKTCS